MDFTTQVEVTKHKNEIDFTSKIITLGSCFSDSIGDKFKYYQFSVLPNPFGVIFNPKSIEILVQRAATSRFFTEADLIFHQELWHSFEVHSDFSATDKQKVLNQLNASLQNFIDYLKTATHFFITYGTSWVYVLKDSTEVVSNCHKIPQNQFEKKLLSVGEIEQSIKNTQQLINEINPACQLIFTVSPVRHIKDGFVENQRSKAHLIAAIPYCIESEENYFPSYEIMMDELRDYRFYAPDMLHPSPLAIDCIWEKLVIALMNESLFPTLLEIDSIQKALAHRAFNPDTESHQKFLKNLHEKIIKLQKTYPQMQFETK